MKEELGADLPRKMRRQLKSFVSGASDEAIDLVVNLTGKYVDEKKRKKLKREAELELTPKIEEAITKGYQIGLKLREEYQRQKLEPRNLREQFHILTDTSLKPFVAPSLPKDVHAFDYLFNVCEDLLKNFRFDWKFLKRTRYRQYLESSERLMHELQKKQKITGAWQILNEFKDSVDFYLILQATAQRVIKYYEYLGRDFSKLEKKQVDKYLEYTENSLGFMKSSFPWSLCW